MRPRSLALVLLVSVSCRTQQVSTSAADPTRPDPRALSFAVAPAPPATMRVHFIDVGQGAATLFEFPTGAVLVDAGGEANVSFDCEAELDAYLAEFFARREDLGGQLTSLILTHPHRDHTEGVSLVLDHYRPRNVVTNGQTYGSGKAQQKLAHAYALQHEDTVGFAAVRVEQIPAGGLGGSVLDPIGPAASGATDPRLIALWGQLGTDPGDWGVSWGKPRFQNNNNHSVVLRVDFGEASVLVTGDLEEVAIEDLLERWDASDLLDVDVYLAGHHGSLNGTTDELVAEMSPEYAVFPVGSPDREFEWTAHDHGHPRREVVSMLEAAIAGTRPPIDVQVGRKASTFDDRTIAKAIYATGWDGTVVLEAGADGVFHVLQPSAGPPLIDINLASAAELEALPKIGPAKAAAIVADRAARGVFATIDALTRVSGIGPATVEAIRAMVTVGGQP